MVQVEDDKAQITAVIQQLDEKKRIALEETWKQVRFQTYNIFSPKTAAVRDVSLTASAPARQGPG
jgi:hypothetical protein